MFDKKYDVKKTYIGYIVAIVKVDLLSNSENVVTFCKIKESIFFQKKNNKYLDLQTGLIYYSIDYGMESGDIVFNDKNMVNLEEYFIKNEIDYKEKMTLNEIETLILDNYNNKEKNETKKQSFSRKR